MFFFPRDNSIAITRTNRIKKGADSKKGSYVIYCFGVKRSQNVPSDGGTSEERVKVADNQRPNFLEIEINSRNLRAAITSSGTPMRRPGEAEVA